MVKNHPQKVLLRKVQEKADLKAGGQTVFYSIIGVIYIISSVVVFPAVNLPFYIYILLYLAFFTFVYFTENKTRKSDKPFQIKSALIVFALCVPVVSLTGGYLSPFKWSLYLLVFVLLNRGYGVHAAAAALLSMLSMIRTGADAQFYIFNAAVIVLCAVNFYTRRQNKGNREKIVFGAPDTGRQPEDLKSVAENMLHNLYEVFMKAVKSESVMLFLRDYADEKKFLLMISVCREGLETDPQYQVSVKEGIIGNILLKEGFNIFDAEGAVLPYYKAGRNAEKLASVPVILNKQIGLIVMDFKKENIVDTESLREIMEALARETGNVIEMLEINQKTLSKERRVSSLYEIYGKLNLLEGKHSLLQTFFKEAESFDIVSGYVAESCDDGKAFMVTEAFGYPEKTKGSVISPKENEILRYVIDSGKSSVVNGLNGRGSGINFGVKAEKFLIAPLRDEDEIYGVIKIDKAEGAFFTEFEIKTLEMLFSRITMLLQNAKLYEKIKKQATQDGLTGLFNHLTFQEKLREITARVNARSLECVSLMLTDIDFFKKFNDSFGHQEGDRVLKKVADMLLHFQHKYHGTFAARYGGEEFVFVLENYDLDKAYKIADEIRCYCRDNLKGGNDREQRSINLSIGVCSYPSLAEDARTLIMNADEALYLAKHNGRNRAEKYVKAAAGQPGS
ncbi:MAG TPA: sensor domain-containing diguanylate cyclase [Candidatus Goldiibacteriota bacterium]|nr:sensor domain-containing diguanylate cyclase [Candidatus Goldiibacteriota bacterium]